MQLLRKQLQRGRPVFNIPHSPCRDRIIFQRDKNQILIGRRRLWRQQGNAERPAAEHRPHAVAKASFYAHVTTPSLGFALVTTGGFVTTNDQQVLNDDYQPIEGLYASGNTCGMRFGPEYVTPIPGVSIGMCLTLGRELGKYRAAK